MIRKVVDLIVTELSTLNFVDRIGGIVKIVEKSDTINDSQQIKTFPSPGKDSDGNHIILTPDSTYKSVIFFEDNGTSATNEKRYTNYESSIRLIAWYNLNKINQTYERGDLLTQTLLYTIPKSFANTDYLTKIRVQFNGEVQKDKAIFSKYSFNEAVLQYLNYPYDYAAINLTVLYSVPRNSSCFDAITINEKVC